MKFKLLIACILIGMSLNLAAQERAIPTFDTYHKNIYVGLLGSNLLIGANYDMRLKKGRMDGIGFRAGVGGMNLSGTDDFGEEVKLGVLTLPLEVNYVVGKRRSGFVAGIGALPMFVDVEGRGTTDGYEYIDVDNSGFGVAGFLDLGYRLQPLKNGFMMQINWNPIFSSEGFSAQWIGIGLGIGFK